MRLDVLPVELEWSQRSDVMIDLFLVIVLPRYSVRWSADTDRYDPVQLQCAQTDNGQTDIRQTYTTQTDIDHTDRHTQRYTDRYHHQNAWMTEVC